MNSIATTSDIIKEMSLELNIPESKIKEIVDLNIKFIKHKVKTSDYLIIRLPNLCTIRFNYRLGKSSFRNFKRLVKIGNSEVKKDSLERRLNILEKIKSETDDWMDLVNFSNPLFERLWRKYRRIKYVEFIYKNSNKIIEDLEIETNNIINKIS